MEKKIIELELIDELYESGTQKISLVDSPAIEKDWMFFKKVEKFVEPKSGEGESDYMSRCVPQLMGEGKDQDQAVAICISTYENFGIDTSNLDPYTSQTPEGKKEDKFPDFDYAAILKKAATLGFSAEELNNSGLTSVEDFEGIDLELAKGYTVYKYQGAVGSDTREFCRQMVNLNRFYTFDEINQLSSSDPNPGFGLEGADNYSIWRYKGGPNCKHKWQKFYINAEGVASNKGPAVGIAGQTPYSMPNRGYAFSQVEDKREIVGPVAIPDFEILRRDKKGNDYYVKFSKDLIRRMAEKFLKEGRVGETNVAHEEIDAGTYIFESWIVEHEGDKANTIYKLDVPVGTWCVKARVVNDAVWSAVKEGKFKGWSLEGSFVTKEEKEAYEKDKKIYETLIEIINKM